MLNFFTDETTQNIIDLVEKMPLKDKETLLLTLKQRSILLKAKILDNSIKHNLTAKEADLITFKVLKNVRSAKKN